MEMTIMQLGHTIRLERQQEEAGGPSVSERKAARDRMHEIAERRRN